MSSEEREAELVRHAARIAHTLEYMADAMYHIAIAFAKSGSGMMEFPNIDMFKTLAETEKGERKNG